MRSPLRALLKTLFQLFLVCGLLAGACLILVSSILKSHDADEYLVDLTRDLGIGLLVSVFVVVFIEWHAGLTLRSEIATDVLEAVYKRLVPDSIYHQVRDNIFRANVVRLGWELDIAVVGPAKSEADILLIESSMEYKLQNLNDHEIKFRVTGGIDLDVDCGDRGVPRFESIQIDGAVWGQSNGLDEACAIKLLDTGEPCKLERDLILTKEGVKQMRFMKDVVFAREGTVQVRYTVRRAIRVPGTYVLSSPAPADGIKIAITSKTGWAFDVLPLHSQRANIRAMGTSRWEFPYGILPWQGFQILSSKEEPAAPPQAVVHA